MNIPENVAESALLADARDHVMRAHAIEGHIRILFGPGSEEYRNYRTMLSRYAEEWDALGSNRGVSIPALTFIGEERAGKSTLVRLLSGKELSGKDQLPGKSHRIRWIGPQKPSTLNLEQEEFELRHREEMLDLGFPYVLIDTPRLESIDQGMEVLMRRVFSSSRFKIVVLQEEKLEREAWQDHIATYRGSVVLPVIRLSPESTKEFPGNCPKLLEDWNRDYAPVIRAKLSDIELENPVFLPHLDAMGGREISVPRITEGLCVRLRELLQAHQGRSQNRMAELTASWEHFQHALRASLTIFDNQLLTQRHHELNKAVDELPGAMVDHLLEDKRRIRALVRMDFREDLMVHIPIWAFPFRTLAGILCLTTGVWDRVILAAAGSIPSAVLAVSGAIRQKRSEVQAQNSHRIGLNTHFVSLSRTAVEAPMRAFHAALKKAGGASDVSGLNDCDFTIGGIDQFVGTWKREFAEASKDSTKNHAKTVTLMALIGTGVFWLLFLGPLVQTYGQYIPAGIRSLTGSWTATNLESYPTPGASFWFSSVILSIIPCFVVALILTSVCLSQKRVGMCVAVIETKMKNHLNEDTLGLRIEAVSPHVEAYRNLVSHVPISRPNVDNK